MGFFTGLLAEKRDAISSFTLKSPPEILKQIFGGIETKAGVSVNENTALGLTAVWSCVLQISRTMAGLPLRVYKDLNPGKDKATEHPLYYLLHKKPNPEMNAYNWRMLLSIQQCLWGAGIAEIEYDTRGYPVALWPLPTWRVRPTRTTGTKELVYEVTASEGQVRKLWPYQVLVFPFWPTIDGGWLSPIGVHRETIGSALAVREFGARTFGQGVNPAGVISGVDYTDENAETNLKKRYGNYEGLGKSHRLMFLEEGLSFTKIGLPPEDAQYLETRRMDIAEVSRMFCWPLFLLNETDKSTSWGSGLEEIKNALVTFNVQPGCTQWEQEINAKLLDDKTRHFAKFEMKGLLRGNIKDRYFAYRIGAALGMYDINTMLDLEDMNPLPGDEGKTRLVPMNMQTLDNAIKGDKNNAET